MEDAYRQASLFFFVLFVCFVCLFVLFYLFVFFALQAERGFFGCIQINDDSIDIGCMYTSCIVKALAFAAAAAAAAAASFGGLCAAETPG